MKGRRVPPSKEEERQGALLSLNIPAMRAWARRYGGCLLGNDEVVLFSMHETRVLDPAMSPFTRRESIRWLREHYPESVVLKEAHADA